ncbi:ferric-chelate reductase-like protein [Cucurbitaria berberidis CBS 394.84]|uniref:Ferric-chelate reductase-like protein n=1 Tax=Cucurbitaria berberidis CBS 394.84 TaxID=1168544 RepID=A0A9P4GLI8_9PLEO|nr:ferric-chelate reductase-like protein [Cucurbitaria berberidis CBS 394.84]KAF1847286.1 ferric-chelate reductase-like protein [Cucurbitaria berberidis CBS 394.84]
MRGYPFIITLCASINVASALYSGKWCPRACATAVDYATFNDTDSSLSRKVRACQSELRINSLYLCFDEYCDSDGEREGWIRDQRPACNKRTNVTLPSYHDVVDRWEPDAKQGVRRLTADDAMKYPVLNETVIPDASFFARSFTTMDAAWWEYDIHLVYGWYMYYFWIVVIAIGIGTRLLSLIRNLNVQNQKYRSIPHTESEPLTRPRSILSRPQAWLKQYLIVPAAFGDRCSRPLGWCTIPPRMQSLTIFLFISFNILLCSCSYRLTDGNIYWPQKTAQLLRYVSDRTGIISLANFPLVWLFGMRNDFLMWITGWGFGTYNAFHKWVARVSTLQAVVHSLGYTLMIIESSGWSYFWQYWTAHYFWNGEVATIAMCAILAFSFYGIRRAHYEIFLITHIVLSIVALWTMYYHVAIFVDGEWNIFIWPCLGFWILDRLLRLGRMLSFNRNPFNTHATVSYDPNSNLVRMDVNGSKNWISPKPGTYYYIYVLNDLLYAYQSHPFTLAYESSDNASPPTPLSPLVPRPPPHRSSSSLSTESTESDALLTPTTKAQSISNLVFLIRPYDGFTSRLKSHCLLHPKKLRVLVEGPYGHTEPLHTFQNVLFIVGGTGIAVPLSHLHRLLQADSLVQSVKIIWAVREHAFLESVLREFKGQLGDERIEMEVHVTRDEDAKDEVLAENLKSVRIMTHRPNVAAAVEETVRDAGQAALAVVACGPALMADEARRTTVEMLGRGFRALEYFEESFKW